MKEVVNRILSGKKEGKHRDAWMKLPDPAQYPEQAETINKERRLI